MSLTYINLKHKNSMPKMWLCKPNLEHTVIDKLTDVYNAKIYWKLGTLNELTFDVPLLVERDHELVKNPTIDKFDGFYHVKVVYNNIIEYFVYVNGNKSFKDDGHTVSYKLYSLGYLLNKKIIRGFEEVESKPLSYFLREFLKETDWSIDYVDVKFDLMYRSFEVSESTVLEAIYNVAEKFGALIKFDTLNQKLSFYQPSNIGINKGLLFKEGNFLESYDVEYNFDEIVTRLYVYGQDGLEFRRLSPTGMNYIESLDWFIYPFEQDSSGRVVKSSRYMSDDLCIAIRKYEAKVKSYEPRFGSLSDQKTNKQDELEQLNHDLSNLESELKQIENELWVINKTLSDMKSENELSQIRNGVDKFNPTQIANMESDRLNAVARKDAKESQIATKKSQMTSVENQITSIDNQINTLRDELKVDNNYTSIQIREMNKFIHHKTHTNDSIVDEEDLLEEGLEVFKKVNQPPVVLNLSVANFLEDVNFEMLKDRIALGDTVRLKSEIMGIYIEAKIIEINFDFNSQSFNLTIANEKNLKDDWTALLDKIYSSSNTSTTVDMDKHKWDKAPETQSIVDDILNSEYDAAKQAITSGYMDLTVLDRFGLKSYEHNNSDTFLFINNGLLAITSDNLNSIEVSISKRGVHAERLIGRVLLGKSLIITDELGTVEIKSGAISIYNPNDKLVARLGRYSLPESPTAIKTGLYLPDGSFDIRTTENNRRGVQLDSNGFRAFNNNGVKTFEVNAQTGQVSIIGGISIKTHPDSNRGVEIDGNGLRIYNDSGLLVFNADHFGNIYYKGKLDGAYGTVDNLGGSIDNMDGTFKGDLVAAGGTFTGTLNGVDGNFSGELRAATGTFGGIVTGSLDADVMRALNIEVDQLRANGIQVDDLSAISSNLGTITGGSITIDTDMKIGNNLYIGNNSDWMSEKSIIFAGSSGITYRSDTLNLTALGEINLEATRVNVIGGGLYVNGVPVG